MSRVVKPIRIQGGECILPEKGSLPCILRISGEDDLGEPGWVDFEFYSCNDLGIRKGGRMPFTTLAKFDPSEVIDLLIASMKLCGCEKKI